MQTFPTLKRNEVDAKEFVKFWSNLYQDPRENLYSNNIGSVPLTPNAIKELFIWKNAGELSERKKIAVQRFVNRRGEPIPTDIKSFLESFGGAIWAIFWLHCRDQSFPIFDQHVYRAMNYIETGMIEEIARSDRAKIDLYIDRYIPFTRTFAQIELRRLDEALWAFGRFLGDYPSALR